MAILDENLKLVDEARERLLKRHGSLAALLDHCAKLEKRLNVNKRKLKRRKTGSTRRTREGVGKT